MLWSWNRAIYLSKTVTWRAGMPFVGLWGCNSSIEENLPDTDVELRVQIESVSSGRKLSTINLPKITRFPNYTSFTFFSKLLPTQSFDFLSLAINRYSCDIAVVWSGCMHVLCGVGLWKCKYITDLNHSLHIIDVGAGLCKEGLMNTHQTVACTRASMKKFEVNAQSNLQKKCACSISPNSCTHKQIQCKDQAAMISNTC